MLYWDVRFRVPDYFASLQVRALPSDAKRKRTGHLPYNDELVLRSGPWYHPVIAMDAEFVAGKVEEDG